MKKYKEYMDGVKASDTLHQRLAQMKESKKRPSPWKGYGAMAAALFLVLGVGGWGLAMSEQGKAMFLDFVRTEHEAAGTLEHAADQPDIAPEDPDVDCEPGEKTIGGYEVVTGSGPDAIVSYYILPYIEYGETDGMEMCLDWDIPKGAVRRDLTREEIAALMGGEDAVNSHLDWGGYDLSGWGAWYEDGSFWGAYLQGHKGPLDHFEFAVTADQLPPTCMVYPESVTQEVRGLTVTADGHDSVASEQGGVDASSRRVSFMKDGYGYRFDITGVSRALTEERVSRLVVRVAEEWLALWTVDESLKTYTCSICGRTLLSSDKVHIHTFIDMDENGSASTQAYDPDQCGLPLAPSAGLDDAMCSGYPVPEGGETHTCPICGAVLPIDVEHSHLPPDPADSQEVCGLPLAPSDFIAETIYCD